MLKSFRLNVNMDSYETTYRLLNFTHLYLGVGIIMGTVPYLLLDYTTLLG